MVMPHGGTTVLRDLTIALLNRSVRFGMVNGRERLLAAGQDGLVYILDKPQSRHLGARQDIFRQFLLDTDVLQQDPKPSRPAIYRTPWVRAPEGKKEVLHSGEATGGDHPPHKAANPGEMKQSASTPLYSSNTP